MINLSDKHIQMDNTDLYEDFRLWISFDSKNDMIECKRQILENKEIVERLRKRIKEISEAINESKVYEYDPCINSLSDELDTILDSQSNGDVEKNEQ